MLRHRAAIQRVLARGLVGTLGGLVVLDIVRSAAGLGDTWWLDLRLLRPGVAQLARGVVGTLLISYAIWPDAGHRRRRATSLALLGLAAIALRDAGSWATLVERGTITSRAPLPLSLALALTSGGLGWLMLRGHATTIGKPARLEHVASATVAGLSAAGLAVLQMVCFGGTDYRRGADAVVVLGARTYADGTPSLALADRVRTGCALVRDGHADKLILSGGPGDGEVHETEAMRRLAIDCGVPSERIILDRGGLNTRHTARNARALLHEGATVLAVSHAYHLPRTKLAFAREGIEAFTVPAEETRTLVQLPYYMAREVAAFWAYYLRDVVEVTTRRTEV